MTWSSFYKTFPFWLLLLLLVAFALRIFQLDGQSIWWDEGISLHLATSSVGDIITDRLNNIHPPLYFFILKGWLSLVGVNAFTARYLSVLASWIQVAAVFVIARRWFSLRTAAAAALLTTLSAVSVIYGQEIRVYAMLSLIYLALLALTRELARPAPLPTNRRMGLWIALGLVTWIGLHLHYITLFVVAYVSAWAIVTFARQQRLPDLRRWLLVLILVGLASLPWFLAVWQNRSAVQGEANAGTFVAEPVPFGFLLAQVWVFHLTGLAGALARPAVRLLAGVTFVSFLLLILARLTQKETRRNTAVLLAHWLVPLSSTLVVWTVRSFSHPRYVSMFAPGLILLIAYLILPPNNRSGQYWTRLADLFAITLATALIISSLWGLWLYFVDPGVAKDDVRGVAHYLQETAASDDLILVPDTDYALQFEYEGPATIAMPELQDPEGGWANLTLLTGETRRVFLMDYRRGTRDWQEVLPFALEKAGTMVKEADFDGLVVRTYELDEPLSAPQVTSKQANFGPLMLMGSWIEQDAPPGGPLTLALRWQLRTPFAEDAQVALRLLDKTSWPLATEDALLLDRDGRPSSQWRVTEPVTTYHQLALPAAIPPLAYDLLVQVYVANGADIRPLDLLDEQNAPQGQEYLIGETQLGTLPAGKTAKLQEPPIAPWAQPVEAAPGLTLLAAKLSNKSLSPGQPLIVHLLWQATDVPLPDLQPELALIQAANELIVSTSAPANGRYPTTLWSKGEQIYEHRQIVIPADAAGEANLMLRLGDKELELGEVDITYQEHSFTQPPVDTLLDAQFGEVARLIGFNLSRDKTTSGEIIPLTLTWQSLSTGTETDFVVFAHLLDGEGRLIGQHDSPPANGTRPTRSWLAGEFIVDHHDISLRENDYRGQAKIEIGLYDPLTGIRLQLSDGSDQLILPVTLNVE